MNHIKFRKILRILIPYLRVIVFPWGLFTLSKIPSQYLKKQIYKDRKISFVLNLPFVFIHLFVYIIFSLPLTLILTVEFIILLNNIIIKEDYSIQLSQSDFLSISTAKSEETIILPGGNPADETLIPDDETIINEENYEYLVKLYSPVIIQQTATRPKYDLPIFFDFDGDEDPTNNIKNAQDQKLFDGGIYGEVTAVTKDSIYILYGIYHLMDYDHPVREFLIPYTHHHDDFEGVMFRVDRETMKIIQADSWFHNLFLSFNLDGNSDGTNPIDGRINFENNTHPIILAPPTGHGVRCAQVEDINHINKSTKIIRYKESQTIKLSASRTRQDDATYQIKNFDQWYEQALGPVRPNESKTSLFQDYMTLGHIDDQPIKIARFIAGDGNTRGIDAWVRPKPPWSWDDKWDNLPVFFWHFFPSYAFETHFGSNLDHQYIYNQPNNKTYKVENDKLLENIDPENSTSAEETRNQYLNRVLEQDGNVQNNDLFEFITKYVHRIVRELG